MPRITALALLISAAWLTALVWFAGDAQAVCEQRASAATCVTILR